MTTHEYLLQKYGTTLSFQQASEETGIFWQTIREMCLRGEIKTPRAGRHWVLTTKALAEFLDNASQSESKESIIRIQPSSKRKTHVQYV